MNEQTGAGVKAGAAFFGSTAAVYVLSGLITAASVGTWYATLAKPPFNPPDWVFAPVWTVLYVMIAVAGWLAWRAAGPGRRRRVALAFGLQLALNGLWTVLFFGLHWPAVALVELCALWAAILWAACVFWRESPLAGLLFIPYALWVAFAILLNASIWWLN